MITFIIGFLCILVGGAGPKLLYHYKVRQLSKKKVRELEANKVDEHGFTKQYDAHLTRKLEIEQGISGKLTQCGDTKCTQCYWKARSNEKHSEFPTRALKTKFENWVQSLPDGLSDELYDSMLEDWLVEVAVELEKAEKAAEEFKKQEERAEMERFYCTPYDQIQKHHAEGRWYDKPNNIWLGKPPKEPRAIATTVTDKPTLSHIGTIDIEIGGEVFTFPSNISASRLEWQISKIQIKQRNAKVVELKEAVKASRINVAELERQHKEWRDTMKRVQENIEKINKSIYTAPAIRPDMPNPGARSKR